MSSKQEQNQAVNQLATLLLPVAGHQLVLPNVTVAEIIPYRQPQAVAERPAWFLGMLEWRTVQVPVISFELINGQAQPAAVRGQRIAVLNGVQGDERLPFCALVTQGVPRLMRVMADEMTEEKEADLGPAEKALLRLSGERAVLPDIDFIQQQLLAVL